MKSKTTVAKTSNQTAAVLHYVFGKLLNFVINVYDGEGVGHTVRWPHGHKWPFWPYLAIYGHMAIGPCAKNMGKQGIPLLCYKH